MEWNRGYQEGTADVVFDSHTHTHTRTQTHTCTQGERERKIVTHYQKIRKKERERERKKQITLTEMGELACTHSLTDLQVETEVMRSSSCVLETDIVVFVWVCVWLGLQVYECPSRLQLCSLSNSIFDNLSLITVSHVVPVCPVHFPFSFSFSLSLSPLSVCLSMCA